MSSPIEHNVHSHYLAPSATSADGEIVTAEGTHATRKQGAEIKPSELSGFTDHGGHPF
jgi:hypothetical protein